MNFQLFSILSKLGSLRQFGISDVDYLGPFQGPGHLGLPRPAIERVDSSHTLDTRAFRLFSEFSRVRDSMAELLPRLTDTPAFAGQPLLATLLSDFATSNEQLTAHFSEIRADPRVVALNGVMISTGSGATVFEESRLKLWYVWCANEF